MRSPAAEVQLVGKLLRSFAAGRNDANRAISLLGPSAVQGNETGRLWRAFLDYDIPDGKVTGAAWWAKASGLPVEVVQEVTHSVPSAANLGESIADVASCAALRKVGQILDETRTAAAEADADAEEVIQVASVRLESLEDALRLARGERREMTAADHYQVYLEQKKSDRGAKRIQSQIPAFDNQLGGGPRAGWLVTLAGRPGMGKSAFAMGWAEEASRRGRVLVYSLEMSKTEFFERYELRGGDGEEGMAYWRARDIVIMDDLRDTTVEGIIRDINRHAREQGDKGKSVDMVVIDHIGLISPSRHLQGRTRENEVSHITRELKKTAKSVGTVVVALSQLNRGVENRDDKAPRLSDLRDSGSIEQDSDVVIGLYRPVYYDASAEKLPDEIRVMKVRQGSVGSVSARFKPSRCEWRPFVPKPVEF